MRFNRCSCVWACRPCLNERWPLRRQLLSSFMSLGGVSLIVALAVVLGTIKYIGEMAEEEATRGLKEQIERHMTQASSEAAATIGERFRALQYAILDVSAYAFRDALEEDLDLAGGGKGYPISPSHTDLRDTELLSSQEANLTYVEQQEGQVDLSRSVWYYRDDTSEWAEVSEENATTIAKSARLDILWPTAYINSIDTKAVFAAINLTSTETAFRRFPGMALYINFTEYYPQFRPWYEEAEKAVCTPGINVLGDAVITPPYLDAGSLRQWVVTLARSVYSDCAGGKKLGVIGVDVLLEDIQESIEVINFLDDGYSILATANNGTIVAAPHHVWNRDNATDLTAVCELEIGICGNSSNAKTWADLLKYEDEVYEWKSSDGENTYLLVAAPVNSTFRLDGEGNTTYYILSTVPEKDIFRQVESMGERIRQSALKIVVITGIVAAATLIGVGWAVYSLSESITQPIVKMTKAAKSIANDGAKTNVFGEAAKQWGKNRGGGTGVGASSVLDRLLCRGEDEINTLAREFGEMINGLGKRGSAARATGLESNSVYPENPFTAPQRERLQPSAPVVTSSPGPEVD